MLREFLLLLHPSYSSSFASYLSQQSEDKKLTTPNSDHETNRSRQVEIDQHSVNAAYHQTIELQLQQHTQQQQKEAMMLQSKVEPEGEEVGLISAREFFAASPLSFGSASLFFLASIRTRKESG